MTVRVLYPWTSQVNTGPVLRADTVAQTPDAQNANVLGQSSSQILPDKVLCEVEIRVLPKSELSQFVIYLCPVLHLLCCISQTI